LSKIAAKKHARSIIYQQPLAEARIQGDQLLSQDDGKLSSYSAEAADRLENFERTAFRPRTPWGRQERQKARLGFWLKDLGCAHCLSHQAGLELGRPVPPTHNATVVDSTLDYYELLLPQRPRTGGPFLYGQAANWICTS